VGRLPGGDQRPYGLAKKMLLVQAQAYRDQYGMNAVYLLPVNLYGPGDNFDLPSSHVIPAMVRKFAEARDRGEPRVVLWGDGSPTREFLHVRDAARAFRLALERYDGPEPVNLGSGEEIAIRKLAALVARPPATGRGRLGQLQAQRPAPAPAGHRPGPDPARLRGRRGPPEGIADLVAWYHRPS